MSYVIKATPQALRAIDSLRGKARESYEQKLRDLVARGCKACSYRLTGYDPPLWICCSHLYADYRLVAAFGNDKEIVILFVGRHRRGQRSDVYRQLIELLELSAPADGIRKKPPCCGKPSDIEVDDAADIETFLSSAEALENIIRRAHQ